MARLRSRVAVTLEVPVARAWEAWTTADEWNKWFTSRASIDLRVGGAYSNADHDCGEFLEIVPRRLLRFSWNNPEHGPGSVVTVLFIALGRQRCRLELTHSRLKTEKDAQGFRTGWSWAYASLRNYLATGNGIRYDEWAAAQSAGKET